MSQITPTQRPMGIGLLGDPSLVFVRKFRYTLKSEHLPCDFVVSTKIDYKERTLSFVYYDVKKEGEADGIHALKWAQRMEYKVYPNETLELCTYDGCGTELYKVKFFGLELLEHKSDFDYNTSDVSAQQIKVSFTDYILDDLVFKYPSSVTKQTKLGIKTNIPVYDSNAEETELNFLNATINIPGRVTVKARSVRREENDTQ